MTNEALHALISAARTLQLDDARAEYPIIRVSNADGEAAIAMHGAHLMDFRPVGAQPLLYLSPTAKFKEGAAIRGGIPICWPWFGAHPSDPEKPAHGFARKVFWALQGVAEPEPGVTELAFRLPRSEMPSELWGFEAELSLTVTIGRALELSLTTTNLGSVPFPIGGALHSYFAVSDINQVSVDGLNGVRFIDSTRNGETAVQAGPIRFDRPINRIYENAGSLTTIEDPGWERRILVKAQGSQTTVVWNSWIEQSRSFKDLPNDGYRRFVCVETANWGDDRPLLEPGQSHALGCHLSLE